MNFYESSKEEAKSRRMRWRKIWHVRMD